MFLTRVVELTNLKFIAVVPDRVERRTSSNEDSPVRPVVQILRFRLVQLCWVRERENDWTINMLCHFLDDFFRKSTRLGRCANQYVGLYFLHHGKQVVMVFAFPLAVFAGIDDLSRSELVFLTF